MLQSRIALKLCANDDVTITNLFQIVFESHCMNAAIVKEYTRFMRINILNIVLSM